MEHMSVTEFIKHYPEYQLQYDNQKWKVHFVGNAYEYDDSVCYTNLYAYYGVFMELFIRKCLCTRFGVACMDGRTFNVLRQYQIKNRSFKHKLSCAYAAYCDPQNRAIDIIDDIKMVALSNRIIHCGEIENMPDIYNMYIDFANLKEVEQFVNSLPYGNMVYKEPCNIEFGSCILRGVPDFIFDGNVFCQIATSMHAGSYKKKFGKIIMYILSHYERTYNHTMDENEYEIMIYNPLLNEVYTTYFLMTPYVYMILHGQVEADMDELLSYNNIYNLTAIQQFS